MALLLRHACDEFLIHCRVAKNLSPHTLRAYAIDLEEFQRFSGVEKPVDAIDRTHLRGFMKHLFDDRGLKETSVKRRIACLKVLFRWLEQEDAVAITPFHRFDARIRLPQRLPRSLTRDEMRRLLDAATLRAALPVRNRYETRALARCASRPGRHPALTTLTVLEVLYCTGMRVGELAAVRLPDLNMGEGIITVNGKGNRQRRVFLPEAGIIRLVGAYLDARAQHSPGHDTLLTSPGGGPATTQHLRSLVVGAGEAASLSRRITPHMLRHTAATHLLESGVDIRFVQRLLGHHSISTTEGYTQVSDTSLRDAIMGVRGGRRG